MTASKQATDAAKDIDEMVGGMIALGSAKGAREKIAEIIDRHFAARTAELEQPVTREWLDEIGKREVNPFGEFWMIGKGEYLVATRFDRWKLKSVRSVVGVIDCEFTTRGQLPALLKGLGVRE